MDKIMHNVDEKVAIGRCYKINANKIKNVLLEISL